MRLQKRRRKSQNLYREGAGSTFVPPSSPDAVFNSNIPLIVSGTTNTAGTLVGTVNGSVIFSQPVGIGTFTVNASTTADANPRQTMVFTLYDYQRSPFASGSLTVPELSYTISGSDFTEDLSWIQRTTFNEAVNAMAKPIFSGLNGNVDTMAAVMSQNTGRNIQDCIPLVQANIDAYKSAFNPAMVQLLSGATSSSVSEINAQSVVLQTAANSPALSPLSAYLAQFNQPISQLPTVTGGISLANQQLLYSLLESPTTPDFTSYIANNAFANAVINLTAPNYTIQLQLSHISLAQPIPSIGASINFNIATPSNTIIDIGISGENLNGLGVEDAKIRVEFQY